MGDFQLDCKGKSCPMPIIEVAKKFKQLQVGDMLEVESDDLAFEGDIKAWVESMKYKLISLQGTKIKTARIEKTR